MWRGMLFPATFEPSLTWEGARFGTGVGPQSANRREEAGYKTPRYIETLDGIASVARAHRARTRRGRFVCRCTSTLRVPDFILPA